MPDGSKAPLRVACTTRRCRWSASLDGDGSWYATKFVEKGPTRGSATGIVRSRHLLVNVSKSADKEAAMREIKRLYVIGALQ